MHEEIRGHIDNEKSYPPGIWYRQVLREQKGNVTRNEEICKEVGMHRQDAGLHARGKMRMGRGTYRSVDYV